ncbi:MAG: glycosyltransferase [Oscillospiraceae bacterium]|nr:glycosyltransferase [Oscillospiraceae bacterium]
MKLRASTVRLNWLVCLMMILSSMVVLQFSGRTAFLFVQVIFCGIMLVNRKSLSFFTDPAVNLIFVELILCAVSACIGDMRYSYKKAAVVMTVYALILYFAAAYLQSMMKKDPKTLPAFIKGIRIMCLVQLAWIPLQFVLYKGFHIDINKKIFVETLHLLENASFIRSWVYYPSGLTWHSAVLAPTLVLAFVLFKNPYIRALILVDALICGNSTTLIGVVLCAALCFLIWIPSDTRGLRFKHTTLVSLVLIAVVGGVVLLKSNILESLINSITYLYQRLFGNTGDASTEAHIGYYLDYFKIIKTSSPIQILFGYGEGCSGYPITVMYNRYTELGNWSIESDIVNLLVSRGILGFVLYYYFLFYIAFAGFRRDPRYFAVMFPVLVQGLGYNVQWDYVFFIELVMYMTLKLDMNFFEPEKHPLLEKEAPTEEHKKPAVAAAAPAGEPAPLVSVLLLTYNADWNKLALTLRSVLQQKHIAFELIIADDGSKVRWDDKIREYCEAQGFTRYTFANSPENGGTCRNVYNGLTVAKGRYTKAISPGDMLYEPTTLYRWVSFMQEQGCDVSFADAVYYNTETGMPMVLQIPAAPRQPGLYRHCHRRSVFVDYLLANDSLSGAAVMMDTALMRSYLEKMLGKVIFAEDYMIRIAVYENKKLLRHPCKAVWYEYGTGVSTAKLEKWAALLKKDFDACNDIIAQLPPCDRLGRLYAKYLQYTGSDSKRKLYKCLLFPDLIYWRLVNRFFGAKSPSERVSVLEDALKDL